MLPDPLLGWVVCLLVSGAVTLGLYRRLSAALLLLCLCGSARGDDTARLRDLLAAGGSVVIEPGEYRVSSALPVSIPGTRVSGYGATIIQTAERTRGLYVTAPGVTIEGLRLVNERGGKDWSKDGRTNAIGISLDGADGATVRAVRIERWGCEAVNVRDSTGVSILDSDLVGIGKAGGLRPGANYNTGIKGYLSGKDSPGLTVRGGSITDCAQGVNLDHDWRGVLLDGVRIDGMAQHGVYANTLTDSAITHLRVSGCGQAGIKLQVIAAAEVDPGNVAITGNVVRGCGQYGIGVTLASGSRRYRGLAITGNAIADSGQAGIDLSAVDDWVVEGNTITGSGKAYGDVYLRASAGIGRRDGQLWRGVGR